MSFLKIADPAKRDLIVGEFLKTKKNIQRNFTSEKLDDFSLQRDLTTRYLKPLLDSQTSMKDSIVTELVPIKEGITTALPSSELKAITFPSSALMTLGSVATEYLRSMASKTESDKTFGLHDKNGKFYIGDSEVAVTGDDIIIGSDTYIGTPGLWELITSKTPDEEIYTSQDLETYKTILLKTHAITDPTTGKVRSSVGEKYRNIIKPIYEKYLKIRDTEGSRTARKKMKMSPTPPLPKIGQGIMLPSDPNALVDMLALRMASYDAGNTGVRNEIIDIADELLRMAVLSREEYKKLMNKFIKYSI